MRRFYSLRSSIDGSSLRIAEMRGTKYLVCPMVSKVGDNVEWPINAPTPEFIPSEVLGFAVHSRNGRPFVMDHPRKDGEYVSANDPEILEKYAFGFITNARFIDGEVKSEAWIDPLLAEQVGGDAPRVVERLQNSETVEVSEGNFVVLREESGTYNGKKYGAVWELCINDHTAALPEGTIGACSIQDGCGAGVLKAAASSGGEIRVTGAGTGTETGRSKTITLLSGGNSSSSIRISVLSQARTPTYTGTESTKWTAPSFSDYIRYLYEGKDGPISVSQCSSSLKRTIASHSLLGDPEANNLRDLTLFPVVNPANGKLNENALRAVLGGRGEQADATPSALESARDVSRRLLNKEFGLELEDSMANESSKGMFQRLVSSVSKMLRSAMSNNLLKNKLWDAIKDKEPGLYWIEDYDTEAKTVIYTTRIVYGYEYDSPVEMHLWRRTYNVDGNDNVAVNDDAIEVQFIGTYEPVTSSDTTQLTVTAKLTPEPQSHTPIFTASTSQPHPCTCKGESAMALSKQEVINRLRTSGLTTLDETMLQNLSEEELATLAALGSKLVPPASATAPSSTSVTPPSPPATSFTSTPPNPVPDREEVRVEAATTKKEEPVISDKDWWDKAPPHLRDMAQKYQEAENARRTDLITRLKTAASAFTEEEITAMPTPTLEKLAKSLNLEDTAARYDFSAQGFPVTPPIPDTRKPKARKPPDTWIVSAERHKKGQAAN